MKQPWEWDENDLHALIADGVPESITLDYKQSAALDRRNPKSREDLSKDVSAFANSAGGTLVYGIAEDTKTHLPERIDAGLDPTDISKEWIEQVINSTIQRRIDGIRIAAIPLAKTSPGRVAYVVCVPQSNRAPHQASDKRFYKRYNFESVAMEEYEVRDASRRFISPDVFVGYRFPEPPYDSVAVMEDNERLVPFTLEVFAGNNSTAPADFCLFRYYIDNRLLISKLSQYNIIECDGMTVSVGVYELEWRGGLRLPIWQDARFQLNEIGISPPRTESKFLLFWEAQAPFMDRRFGSYELVVENGRAYIRERSGLWHLQREVYRRV